MTMRVVKAVAVIVNVALFGLTIFTLAQGVDLEGPDVVLVLVMILAPVVNLAALHWPSPLPSAVPAPRGATEGQG
jgi:uncharacterized membrane protein